MSEWRSYRLVDFININPRIELHKDMNYSFVEMKDLDSNIRYVEPSCKKRLNGGSRFCNGDTLFARITPCLENGKICQVKDLENNCGFGSTEFLVLRGKRDISDNDFVYYLSRTAFLRNKAIQNMTGTSGRQRVDKSAFEQIEIIVPSDIFEQSRIVSILSSLDDKIELNLRMNKTLEAIAQAIFKDWFVDFRFPEFDGKLVNGLPKGWKISDLSEVSTLVAGGDKPITYSIQSDGQCKIPIYSNGISDEGLYGFTDKPRIYEESVTVSARGTIGYVCLRMQPYVPIVRLIAVIPNRSFISSKYLYLWLRNQNISGTGTTQQQLTVPDFSRTKILIPKIDIVNEYTLIMDSIFQKMNSNASEIQILTQLRDTLLPKLMTGKIKVA